MSRFNPTAELEAELPDTMPCIGCGQSAPRTFVHRKQLLGWQVDAATYRCDDCTLTIRLTTDASRLY